MPCKRGGCLWTHSGVCQEIRDQNRMVLVLAFRAKQTGFAFWPLRAHSCCETLSKRLSLSDPHTRTCAARVPLVPMLGKSCDEMHVQQKLPSALHGAWLCNSPQSTKVQRSGKEGDPHLQLVSTSLLRILSSSQGLVLGSDRPWRAMPAPPRLLPQVARAVESTCPHTVQVQPALPALPSVKFHETTPFSLDKQNFAILNNQITADLAWGAFQFT